MEILLRWCLGLLRETSTHLESVILPWVKPAYPLVVPCLPLASFIFLPAVRVALPTISLPDASGYVSCTYLVIFALSTANKFTFANGKCHFIVRRGNDLSKFSPKDINKKSGSAVCSGSVTRPPIYAGFRKGGRIYDTKLIFGKARGVLNRRVVLVSGETEKYRKCAPRGMWNQPTTTGLRRYKRFDLIEPSGNVCRRFMLASLLPCRVADMLLYVRDACYISERVDRSWFSI